MKAAISGESETGTGAFKLVVVIALNISTRVLQHFFGVYLAYGLPGWSAHFIIVYPCSTMCSHYHGVKETDRFQRYFGVSAPMSGDAAI